MTALLRAGFHVKHRAQGLALLKRGTKVVLVPAVDIVTTEMFDSIAKSAGLSHAELEGHLPRSGRISGTFTRPTYEATDISPPSSAGGGRRRRR